MPNLLQNIADTGIQSDTPFHLRNKLRVFNNAVMLVLFISLFYLVVGIVNRFYLGVTLTVFSVLSTFLAFYLVSRARYAVAFHYMMWYGFIFLSGFTILFGRINNSYYYFLFMPIAANILFDCLTTMLVYTVISAVMLVANAFYIDHYPPYYVLENWLAYFGYPNAVFAIALVHMGVRVFKQENLAYAGQIDQQRRVLEEKNHEITDSINYARRIQDALIPSEQEFNAHFKEAFVLFRPKDIVSGDFYWITRRQGKIYYATADCTGHGVPGGFMTMLGISFLDEIINEKGVEKPAAILDALRDRLVHTLKQSGTAGESKDGMDIVLCCIDLQSNTLDFAAANNSLYVLRNGSLADHKGDRQPCGFYHNSRPFTDHRISLQPGDCVYTFSDGYADQFGGPKGKKFKYKQLQETLLASHYKSFAEQKRGFGQVFDAWKVPLEQVDDVLLVGIKI